MKFNNKKYIYSKPFGSARHHWEILGPKAALHFHASIYKDDVSCGLEIHYFEPPEYMKDQAPSHVDCKIVGGRCWHDGTSLYASETLWPLIKGHLQMGNHDKVFSVLENEYKSRFGGEEIIGGESETPPKNAEESV